MSFLCHENSPLIHILEHTVRCVCGGEDAFVCRDSGCCGEIKERWKMKL